MGNLRLNILASRGGVVVTKIKQFTVLSTALIAGCSSPYAQQLDYDNSVANAYGTISISDPKLYSREALIEERRDDISWIDSLMQDSINSTKIRFQPEIIREVEQISSFAAALGLSFDPAAGLNYRRDQEAGDIQQEIDTLRLQLELDQLRRDAELFRAVLAEQTEVSSETLGDLGESGVDDATSTAAASVGQLNAAITALNTSLATALAAEGRLPTAPVGVSTSPFDDFRDRAAYRDLLKSARNAASLDELHDANGSSLIRLNFQTTIIPDPRYPASLGAIEMRIVPPDTTALEQFFEGWIDYLNFDSEFTLDSARRNATLERLSRRNDLERLILGDQQLILPLRSSSGRAPFDVVRLLSSNSAGLSSSQVRGMFQRLDERFVDVDDPENVRFFAIACGEEQVANPSDYQSEALFVRSRLHQLRTLYSYPLLVNYLDRAPSNQELQNFFANLQALDELAQKFVNAPFSHPASACGRGIGASLIPAGDYDMASDGALGRRVRVYEIGPREQVQQVSTVARSANSLALAASIAASDPSSGASANAAAQYSRQAVGRAAALERVPSVVGYSISDGPFSERSAASQRTVFGWVLGPRAVLNPQGEIEMQQTLRSYDLSVDLSVPSWWDAVTIQTWTAWGPSPQALAGGTIADALLVANAGNSDSANNRAANAPYRTVRVPLANDTDRFRGFTDALLAAAGAGPRVDSVVGGPINACSATSIALLGDNLWRAERAMVFGQVIGREKIDVLPDMRGIIVEVPKFDPRPYFTANPELTIFTRNGGIPVDGIGWQPSPAGSACQANAGAGGAAAGAAISQPDPNAATIATINGGAAPNSRLISSQTQHLDFTVRGQNLDKITEVTFYGFAQVTITPAADKKSLTVRFAGADVTSIPQSRNVPLVFRAGNSVVKTYNVEIIRSENN